MHKTQFLLNVPTTDLDLFSACCREAGWDVVDGGDRVTTEDGLDGEAVILVAAPTPRVERELVAACAQ